MINNYSFYDLVACIKRTWELVWAVHTFFLSVQGRQTRAWNFPNVKSLEGDKKLPYVNQTFSFFWWFLYKFTVYLLIVANSHTEELP